MKCLEQLGKVLIQLYTWTNTCH